MMDNIVQGFTQFREQVFPNQRSVYQRLVHDGQQPKALVISCADSRVVPELITQAGPGERVTYTVAGLVLLYIWEFDFGLELVEKVFGKMEGDIAEVQAPGGVREQVGIPPGGSRYRYWQASLRSMDQDRVVTSREPTVPKVWDRDGHPHQCALVEPSPAKPSQPKKPLPREIGVLSSHHRFQAVV